MRKARIKIHGRTAVYHCISRIVGGQLLLKDFCQERFRQMMWRQAEFCGVELNPVRAGLVEDPKDYRFSGYGCVT